MWPMPHTALLTSLAGSRLCCSSGHLLPSSHSAIILGSRCNFIGLCLSHQMINLRGWELGHVPRKAPCTGGGPVV